MLAATAAICLLGLLAELASAAFGLEGAAAVLSLSYEGNLPTWYASALPLLIAALLAWIAALTPADRPYWRGLALGFLLISIDEVVGGHEHLSALFDTGGVLYFGWVIPAGALVLVLGLTYLGFLRRLPRETAKQFTLAGALYLTGALLLELPLGYWTERHGDDGLGYALIDWCEETLEFVGLTLFARHLLDLLDGRALRLRGRDAEPPSHITAPHRPDETVVPEVHQRDDQRR